MSLKRRISATVLVCFVLTLFQFTPVSAAIGDIRFDFDDGTEGFILKNTTLDTLTVKDGVLTGVISKSKTLSGKQIQIAMPKVDFGDGGYYMHINAKYEFSKDVVLDAHFAAIFNDPNEQYPTVYGTSYSTWNDFKTITYDITSVTGEKYPAWYLAIKKDSAKGTGQVSIESVVFSKSSTPPKVVAGEEVPYIELYNNSDSKAIRLLVSMGIMDYDKDTNLFWDDTPMKRSQMADLLCRLHGVQAKDNSERLFDDVTEEDRAYIETAVSNGYMSGYGNRRFGPDEYITGNQIVKIFVTLLGGQSAAEKLGGFPNGYLTVARQLGLKYSNIDNINGYVTRRNVANTIYEAMHADYMNVSGFKGDTAIYEMIEGKTFLTETLGIYRLNGVMSADNATSVTTAGGMGDKRVVIGKTVVNDPSRVTEGFLGYDVIVYEKRSDEDVPGDVIYIEKSNNNREVLMDRKNVVLEDVTGQKVDYWDEERGRRKKITLSPAIDMIFNGVAESYSIGKLKSQTNDEITFIDNDDDGQYDVVIVYDYNDYMTNVIRAEENSISLEYDEPTLRFEDNVVRIYNGDIPIRLDELGSKQIISVAVSNNTSGSKVYTIKTGMPAFSGTVDSLSGSGNNRVLEIDGIEYNLGVYAHNLISRNKISDIKSNDEATFYRNYAGDIAVYKLGNSTDNVACLVKCAIDDDSLDPILQIMLYTQTGKLIKLNSKDKVVINGAKRSVYDILNDSALMERLKGKQLVKFRSSGDILKSLTLAEDGYNPNEFSKDVPSQQLKCTRTSILAENINGEYIGEKYRITSNTITFRVPINNSLTDGKAYLDESLYWVRKGSSPARGTTGTMELYDIMENGNVSYAIWTYRPYWDMLEYGHSLAVVTRTGKMLNDDGEVVDVVYGYDENGADVTLRLRSDAVLLSGLTIETLKPGDIINYLLDTVTGDVFQIKLRVSIDTDEQVKGVSNATNVNEILLCIGKVAFKSNEQFSIYIGDIEPATPLDVQGIISNTNGKAIYLVDTATRRNSVTPIEFDQIEKNDKVCAVLNSSNKTRILVVYR